MKKKGFTLIELLAVIVILAIIALITVPVVINIIDDANKQSFKTDMQSIIRSYEYKEVTDGTPLGEVEICSLDISSCNFNGTVLRNEDDEIIIKNITDGNYCAYGTLNNLQILNGSCGEDDNTSPIISNLTFSTTTSSITAFTSFSEDGIIKNVEFSLMDSDNNLLKPYESYDLLSGTDEKVAKKTFEGLTAGATYKVEVKVTNNSLFENNYATLVGEVTLNTFDSPVITYNKNEWASNKNVTITYDSGLNNQYRIVDKDLKPVTVWKSASNNEIVNVNKSGYTIQARSSDGVTTFSTSEQIEKIDNIKPVLSISNNNITWSNVDGITLSMSDDLSGLDSYCVLDSDNISLCNWIPVNNVLSVSINHIFNNAGTYMAYVKDLAGNISLGKEVVVNKATGTVTAPTAKTLTYTGSAQALVNAGSTTTGTIQYKLEGGSYSTTIPTGTNAGTYKVYYKVVADSNHLDVEETSINVTINKASGIVTAPTAKTLTYNGTAQALINIGSSSTGEIQYKLDGGSYSTSVPTGTNAGTYKVYYKVVADSNHLDVEEASINVTINKAASSVICSNKTYTGSSQIIATAQGCTLSGQNQTNAGSYTVSCTGDANHNNSSNTCSIAKSATASTGSCSSLTYNGSSRTLASGGSYVSYSNNTATNAGSYTVTVTSDSNHLFSDGTASKSLTCSISKAAGSVTVPTAKTLTYTGSAQALVNAGSSSTGTLQYKLEGGNYSATIPTGINAGTYKVYYKVIGDSNHLDVAESSINVTINKANNVITLSSNTGTVTYPNAGTFTITKNLSGGTLSCSSSNDSAATCSISGSTVTVTPGTQAASNVTLTIKSKETSNYNAGQVTYTLVSQNGVLSYTANNYSGTYDGSSHTISVTSSGSTIRYASDVGLIANNIIDINSTTLSDGIYTFNNNTSGNVLNAFEMQVWNNSGTYLSSFAGTSSVGKGTREYTHSYDTGTYVIRIKANGSTADSSVRYGNIYLEKGKKYIISFEVTKVTTTQVIAKDIIMRTEYNLTSAPTYKNAGTYPVYYQITKSGYVAVTGSKTVTISKAKTATTGSCASLTYNGSSRTLASGGSYVSYSNNTATNAGSYTVTVNADSNHLFSDGASSKTLSCSIAKAASSVSCVSRTYTGSSQTIATSSGCTLSGQNQTNAGNYTLSCTGDANHNNSSNTCSIARAKTATTGSCASLTYNGSSRTLASGGSYVSYSNNTATNAGSYTVTVNADSNHLFSDGTSSKTLTCSIGISRTITYNANGGSGAPASQSCSGAASSNNASCNITISSTVPTRSGFDFMGWSTSSTATSATYMKGSTYGFTSNITLYAVWAVSDTSGANPPILASNMLPVYFNSSDSKWHIADSSNTNASYKWYNYSNKQWANAVILSSSYTGSKTVGTAIDDSYIDQIYVWIPRYKYTIFNGNNGAVSERVISIAFENGTSTTGTVRCSNSLSSTYSETCSDSTYGSVTNGSSTYTHPAFTFGTTQLTGFWIGKFENAGTLSKIKIGPGLSTILNNTISSYYNAIAGIQSSYNITLSGKKVDTHLIKNIEWGAVAYLKQSAFGSGNVNIGINNCWPILTGCGAVAGSSYSSTTNKYYSTNGMLASTTGNVYGVYDMSGGASEFVMAYMATSSNGFNVSASGFTSSPASKYVDVYGYNTSSTAFSRGKLGDATKEVVKTLNTNNGGWYSDYSHFMYGSNYAYMVRGGYFMDQDVSGIMTFSSWSDGGVNSNYGSRTILVFDNNVSYSCPSGGTLTADSSRGASSGGYICVASNATSTKKYTKQSKQCYQTICILHNYTSDSDCVTGLSSCSPSSATCSSQSDAGNTLVSCTSLVNGTYMRCTRTCYYGVEGCEQTYQFGSVQTEYNLDSCTPNNIGCSYSTQGQYNVTCTEQSATYTCPSGWSTYSGSGSSLTCYKAATLN